MTQTIEQRLIELIEANNTKVVKPETIGQLKAAAVIRETGKPINELMGRAYFNDPRRGATSNLGYIPCGTVRIWIDRDGNLFANKPKGKKYN